MPSYGTYIKMYAGYKHVNTRLQQYHAFVVRVCVVVCVCESSATEAHNFPTCGIAGDGVG